NFKRGGIILSRYSRTNDAGKNGDYSVRHVAAFLKEVFPLSPHPLTLFKNFKRGGNNNVEVFTYE
ncbi:MAG: hypothetical protein IJW16_00110, partial [Clostridia bacterium]|nr:hypothetical protein [Clostridia bacterium]